MSLCLEGNFSAKKNKIHFFPFQFHWNYKEVSHFTSSIQETENTLLFQTRIDSPREGSQGKH